ncbi:hypothetical protein [Egicoccus sp. AB-alg2]|uniref:hypothetical protein n=1 Tax=Egicoccus sp. AB-alg2 TaxID=3242693 RepID=UPI00359E645F
MLTSRYDREHACESRCSARGSTTVHIHGRPFRFCRHHARAVEAAYTADDLGAERAAVATLVRHEADRPRRAPRNEP